MGKMYQTDSLTVKFEKDISYSRHEFQGVPHLNDGKQVPITISDWVFYNTRLPLQSHSLGIVIGLSWYSPNGKQLINSSFVTGVTRKQVRGILAFSITKMRQSISTLVRLSRERGYHSNEGWLLQIPKQLSLSVIFWLFLLWEGKTLSRPVGIWV
jgi:uncharacterized membrane protein